MQESGLSFRLFGFPVHVPWGGLVGVLLIAYLWEPAFRPAGWGLAALFAVLLYAAVLIHELAHAVAARAYGYPVTGITLWLLGGFTIYERRRGRPWPELIIAVVGPASTLLVAVVCAIAATATQGASSALFAALAWTNALLGFVNLLPGLPLDGGAAVRSIVWRVTGSEAKGTVAASWAGLIIAALIAVWVLWSLAGGGSGTLLGLVLAGFIGFGAYQSLRSAKTQHILDQHTLASLTRPVLVVDDQASVTDVLRSWHNGGFLAAVTVDGRGRLLSNISPEALTAIPEQRRGIPVSPFATAIPANQRINDSSDLRSAISVLVETQTPMVFVCDDDQRPRGILFAGDINAISERS